MRLTLINQFYTPDVSPTAHLCASLAEYRATMGDDVTVLTSRTGYALKVRQAESGGFIENCHHPKAVRVRRLWSTCFGSRSNLGRLLDWVTFYLPAFWAAATLPRQDIVIVLTTPPFIALAGWLHKLIHPSSRLILWNMDVYPEALERTNLVKANSIISRVMRSANRAIFRRLSHLITLDSAMAELLLSQYAPRDGQLAHTIIPNWESLSLFPGNPDCGPHESVGSAPRTAFSATKEMVRGADPTEFQHEREKLVVLYLGNAGFGHEFQTLIDAACNLRDEPVEFLFIGGGALRPWIANQIAAHNLSNINLQDYVPKDQTPRVMRDADCALITLENAMLGVMSPSKLHANLAIGLPVIYVGPRGSNVDGAIERFACGMSFRPGQAKEMVEFIRGLINDRGKLADLGVQARQAFEQAYCDRSTLPRFDAVIESVRRDTESRGTDPSVP